MQRKSVISQFEWDVSTKIKSVMKTGEGISAITVWSKAWDHQFIFLFLKKHHKFNQLLYASFLLTSSFILVENKQKYSPPLQNPYTCFHYPDLQKYSKLYMFCNYDALGKKRESIWQWDWNKSFRSRA